jgi:multidrug efflux pump subunit AcrA (membrane-fusion protein)
MKTVFLAPLALLVILCGCAKVKEKESEPVVPVQVADVRSEPIQRVITAEGILRAFDQSAVTPKISAPVSRFYVNRGDHVRKGQLLAILENRDLAASVVDAKGSYEQAAANYRNISSAIVPDEIVKARSDVEAFQQQVDAAKKLLDNREQLQKEGALSRKLVDEAVVAYAQAKSQYDTARKHLESVQNVGRHEEVKGAGGQLESAKGKFEAAQAQLSYSEVRSLISGVVADRAVYAGEMAAAGTPLVTIVDVSSVIARMNIPQQQAAYLRVGQAARVVATDSSVETSGKISVISPAVDPQSTTVEVWVQAPNPGERLRPGGTVHITIAAETIQSAVVVPPAALLPTDEGGVALMVVGPDSIAQQHKVEVGIRTAEKVQILSGAEPGQKVVVAGGVGLQNGAKVSVEKPGQAGEKAEGSGEKKVVGGDQKSTPDAGKAGGHE